MPFVSDKKTGGWWFAREIADGFSGRCEEEVIAECELRNVQRLESKKTSARMAQREYREARKSYLAEATVKYLKDRNV